MDEAVRTDRKAGSLYESDFAAWALDQAARLRRAGDGCVAGLDWLNLAEEVEALARRDRRELASHVGTIAEHLIKLQASPATEPRAKWRQTIRNARREIELILKDSPSLAPAVSDLAEQELAWAQRAATEALDQYGETPSVDPVKLSYTAAQITGDWWP